MQGFDYGWFNTILYVRHYHLGDTHDCHEHPCFK